MSALACFTTPISDAAVTIGIPSHFFLYTAYHSDDDSFLSFFPRLSINVAASVYTRIKKAKHLTLEFPTTAAFKLTPAAENPTQRTKKS